MIPLVRPAIDDSDIEAVTRVLRSGRLVQGPEVEAFERALTRVTGSRHAVAVSSGTAALLAALAGLGVGPGDVVLVGAYSWIASANVVELLGARTRFVDIEYHTLGMDPTRLHETMSEELRLGSRVAAVLPVHAFGAIADMKSINEIADQAGVPVVEDAACALGAELDGQAAGTMSRAGCFSFHPRKVITTGEGGAVITDDERLARFVRAFRNHGQVPGPNGTEFGLIGHNLRMTDFQAALGASQLSRLDSLLAERRSQLETYRVLLQGTGIEAPQVGGMRTSVQAFVALLPLGADRDRLVTRLRERGIEAAIGTIAMPFTDVFQRRYGAAEEDYPVTADVGRRAIALPLFPGLSPDHQARVIAVLTSMVGESRSGR